MNTTFFAAMLRPFVALCIFMVAYLVNFVFTKYAKDGKIKRFLLRKIT